MKNKITYLSAQPDNEYFIWQLKVQMYNFRKRKIEDDAIVLLGYDPVVGVSQDAQKFANSTSANVTFFPDTRKEKRYISSIRPHLIKKLFVSQYFLIKDSTIFYHDSDIVFRALPTFGSMLKDEINYLSDTVSYIGAKYIKGKSDELFERMAQIVGVKPSNIVKNEKNSGGAQYLLKNTTPQFWMKVEKDCNKLFELMSSTSNVYSPDSPIQSWTADMWAVLWNLWYFNKETKVSKELEFSWATDPIENWKQRKIYHNAGVTEKNENLFRKSAYTKKSPFGEDFNWVDKTKCSYKYVQMIKETEKHY